VALREEEFTSLCDDVDLDRDRTLVERCQAGDSGAFGNLYARYYERLLRFCLRRLNDRHEAEDAAQEAFARAWKALPNFAGERRFYPWLTVIAGNICTDMLRRRSRSTPTDDLELSAHQPVGAGGSETSEELVLAAVDGELVTKALGRLSVRHRHVLAMREGSGWTYQQIADHEGVEIGTIETLLWRARQALKREFTVLSESKGMMGGFLVGAGALVRRGFFKATHRSANLQHAGGGGIVRNTFAGVAVTSATVAAALITPHVLTTTVPPSPSAASVPFAAAVTNPTLSATSAATPPAATTPSTTPTTAPPDSVTGAKAATTGTTGTTIPVGGSGTGTPPSSSTATTLVPALPPAAQTVTQALGQATQQLSGVASTLNQTISGLGSALGVALPPLTPSTSSSGNSTSLVGGLLSGVGSTLNSVLGGAG
jgi:RNA polymerase sigma-70 factor (ECF subfamily)